MYLLHHAVYQLRIIRRGTIITCAIKGLTVCVSFSFSIDDGSSSAFVNCNGDEVARLLDLNVEQWTELEDLVRPLGHVSYELVSEPVS